MHGQQGSDIALINNNVNKNKTSDFSKTIGNVDKEIADNDRNTDNKTTATDNAVSSTQKPFKASRPSINGNQRVTRSRISGYKPTVTKSSIISAKEYQLSSSSFSPNEDKNNTAISQPVPPLTEPSNGKKRVKPIVTKQSLFGIISQVSKILPNPKTVFYLSVGKGNNGNLVRNVFLSRPWWNALNSDDEGKIPNLRWQQLTPSTQKYVNVYQSNGPIVTGNENTLVYNHLPQNALLHSKVSLWELMSYRLRALGYNIYDVLPVTYLYSNPIGCAKMQAHYRYQDARITKQNNNSVDEQQPQSGKEKTDSKLLPFPTPTQTKNILNNQKLNTADDHNETSSEEEAIVLPPIDVNHQPTQSSSTSPLAQRSYNSPNLDKCIATTGEENIKLPYICSSKNRSCSNAQDGRIGRERRIASSFSSSISKVGSTNKTSEGHAITTYRSIPVMSVRSQDVPLMSVKTMKKCVIKLGDLGQGNTKENSDNSTAMESNYNGNANEGKENRPQQSSSPGIIYPSIYSPTRSVSNPANSYKYSTNKNMFTTKNPATNNNNNNGIKKFNGISNKLKRNGDVANQITLTGNPKEDMYLGQISREIAATKKDVTNMWIVKPSGLNRGRGVRVISTIEELETHIRICKKQETLDIDNDGSSNSPKKNTTVGNTCSSSSCEDVSENEECLKTTESNNTKHQKLIKNMVANAVHGVTDVTCCGMQFLVQKYLETPLLIDGRKFDIRCYGLAVFNGECYYYRDGYLRTSTKEFTLDTLDARVHLTNNAVQKDLDGYATYEDGNMRDYDFLNEYINQIERKKAKNQGQPLDESRLDIFYNRIWHKMQEIIAIAMETAGSRMAIINDSSRNATYDATGCFELFGFDFMITDENSDYKPILIEVNSNPCLALSSDTSWSILPRMLDDLLELTVDKFYGIPKYYIEQLQKKANECKDIITREFINESSNGTDKNNDTQFVKTETCIIEKNNIGLYGRRGKPAPFILENDVDIRNSISNSVADTLAVGGAERGFFPDGLRWACLIDPSYPVICRKNRWVRCLSKWQRVNSNNGGNADKK